MSIKFFLIDNPLTPDPRDCRAQVVTNGSRTLDDAIEEALKRGTLVTRTDLKAVTEILFDVLTDFVAEGLIVITPLSKIRPSIKGAFADEEAPFSRGVHELKASHSSGALLQKKLANASVQKIKPTKNDPRLLRFSDQKSGTSNEEITPGGMALLTGEMLAFERTDADQGLFFIDLSGTETRVSDILEASAKRVSFSIPSGLSTGEYILELRTRFYAQKMRSGQLTELQVR